MICGTPTADQIEAVGQVFLEAGVFIGQPRERRERAAWFCEHHGGRDQAELLAAYVEQEAGEGHRSGGLLFHILDDGTRTKEALQYMRSQAEHRAQRNTRPAMDLGDSAEHKARSAGYEGVEQWESARTQAIMWDRWQFERRHLDYDDRLQDIAAEFGRSIEDTYDILTAECLRHYQTLIETLQQRVTGIPEELESSSKAWVSEAVIAAQERLGQVREEAAGVHGLQDFHAKERERTEAAKKELRGKRII